MMKNYWKQLGVSAIRSKDDPFARSRLNLTLIVFGILLLMFIIGHYLIGLHLAERYVIGLTLVGTLIGFMLSGIALSPLRHMVRAQKRFIADASHELRTPLSIIKADSEIALIDGLQLKPEEAITTLKSNLEEVDRMSKIIENLLSMSFYENKLIKIPLTPVDLNEIARNITQKAHSVALKKGINLSAIAGEPAVVMGNPTALEQMTMNLVRNAIFYTPEGGTVKVSVRKNGQSNAELIIQDTGIGISPHDLPNVFNPFYRADARNRGSSGLGLTIVKKIVDRHNGLITLKSELGKGTSVTVILPTI